jgi:23S rRNA (cytosine1962-C5)-methyltransferase
MITVELTRAHAGPVAAGHPWVFAQAVAQVRGTPEPGDEVQVLDADRRPLGRGLWSPSSAIVVRMLTRDPERAIDASLLRERLQNAVEARALFGLPSTETTGYRLVSSEGDYLPGLTVDRYGDTLVAQLGTIGMQRRKELLVELLAELIAPRVIVEVTSKSAQEREGFAVEGGVLFGAKGDALSFRERGLEFSLPPDSMQKTGYYFDQREHRAAVEAFAKDRDVLDICSYVGGFSLAAARGGAKRVRALDSSQHALDVGAKLARDNGLTQLTFERADARKDLEPMSRSGDRFDMVILDPPKLVPSAKHFERGRKAYRQLNRYALGLLRDGGVFVTCSCSAGMTEVDFLRTISLAARDARRELSVFRVGRQGPDHPIPPGFSEGAYLKTVFAVVR